MSGPSTAPARVDESQLAVTVDRRDSVIRLLVTGRVVSACDASAVRGAIHAALRESATRIVVDLNGVEDLDASVLEVVVALRQDAPDTVIAIDISRVHGPLLLALLAQLLEPGGPHDRRGG
jgi:hypothetical protein